MQGVDGRNKPGYDESRVVGIEAAAPRVRGYELAFSTVTARRFCDQQEMSLQTATGRSLP